MRQSEPEGQQFHVPAVERHTAYRLARLLGNLLHAPRAWLNQQVALARLGMSAGDSAAFMRQYRRQFPMRVLDPTEAVAAAGQQTVSRAS